MKSSACTTFVAIGVLLAASLGRVHAQSTAGVPDQQPQQIQDYAQQIAQEVANGTLTPQQAMQQIQEHAQQLAQESQQQNNSAAYVSAQPSGRYRSSSSGRYIQPMPPSCVRMFNDSRMYGWVALQNTCSQKMTVTFEGQSGRGVFGTMDLAPGQSYNTGFSPSEIAAVGGIRWYPCAYGYIPTNMNGHDAVTAPVTEFTCKYRGY